MKKILIILTLVTAFGCSSPETETIELEIPPPVSEAELNQILGIDDSESTPNSTPGIEQIDNDTVPEQESGPNTSNEVIADTSPVQESGSDTSSDANPDPSPEQETSNDTNPGTNPELESGPDTSNNSFSRRVSSLEFGDRVEILWQDFYVYDDAGKLVTVTRRHSSEFLSDDIITYQYNVDGLLTAKSRDISGDGTVDQLITFEYDEQGRVISMADDLLNTGELVDYTYYSYDNEGRLAGFDEYVYYNDGALSYTGTYVYDENNVRTGLNLDFLDGGSISTRSYIYSEAGELETKEIASSSSEYYQFEDGPCSSAHLILDDDVLCR